jgi:hypothetical protein
MTATAAVSRSRPPLFPTRKIVHISMLGFAFLLPFLTWCCSGGVLTAAYSALPPRAGSERRYSATTRPILCERQS